MTTATNGATRGELDWLVRAMREAGHPVRLDILLWLNERPLSPVEFVAVIASDRGDAPTLGTAAYHFRTLADDGRIRIHKRRQVRGAIEHIYRLSAKGERSVAIIAEGPEREAASLPPAPRSQRRRAPDLAPRVRASKGRDNRA